MRSWTKGQGASSVVGGGGNCFMMRWAKVMIVFRYGYGLLFSSTSRLVEKNRCTWLHIELPAGGRAGAPRNIQHTVRFCE